MYAIRSYYEQDIGNSLEYIKKIAGERQAGVIESAFKEAMQNFGNVDLIFNLEENNGGTENLILLRAKIYYNLSRQPVKIMGRITSYNVCYTKLLRALGPEIARWLEEPAVIEVMLNPDGRLWVDRLGEGLAATDCLMDRNNFV